MKINLESIIQQFVKNKKLNERNFISSLGEFENYLIKNPWKNKTDLFYMTNLSDKKIDFLISYFNFICLQIDENKFLYLKEDYDKNIYFRNYNFCNYYFYLKKQNVEFCYFGYYLLKTLDNKTLEFLLLWFRNNSSNVNEEFYFIDCCILDPRKLEKRNEKIKNFILDNETNFNNVTRFCIFNGNKFNLQNYCLNNEYLKFNIRISDDYFDPFTKEMYDYFEDVLKIQNTITQKQFMNNFFLKFTNTNLKMFVTNYENKLKFIFDTNGFVYK